MPLLQVNDLRVGYEAADVLHGVSVSIDAGETVAVLGANGAGKSTLLKAIMGLVPARGGTVWLDDADVSGLTTAARVRHGIALVPEGRQVFSSLTVEENLVLGFYARLGHGRRAAHDELESVWTTFPRLHERHMQLAGDLSGGEQQMLAVGRALMAQPRCLLIDELSLGLAPSIVEDINVRLRAVAAERELSLCIVEQNTETAARMAGRGYVLANGRTVLSGNMRELMGDGRLAEAYLRADGVRS